MGRLKPGITLEQAQADMNTIGARLERYRDRLCTFNDDIQGTGAGTVAGLLAASSREQLAKE